MKFLLSTRDYVRTVLSYLRIIGLKNSNKKTLYPTDAHISSFLAGYTRFLMVKVYLTGCSLHWHSFCFLSVQSKIVYEEFFGFILYLMSLFLPLHNLCTINPTLEIVESDCNMRPWMKQSR